MLSVADAIIAVLREVSPFPPAAFPLGEALGLVLVDDAKSDIDSPPFDKSLMDGYAVRSEDVANGTADLVVIEEVTAGRVPTRKVGTGEATRIMTGAQLPPGSDAVVKVEDTQLDSSGHRVKISTAPLRPGVSVMKQGTSLRRGSVVACAGKLLRAQELGALAEIGKASISARRRPKVAVLATGNELVPVEQTPGPGQIRNSNETMLVAQLRTAGAEPVPLGVARDERPQLRERLQIGLQNDILILSGGVSAGKLDLVPSALDAAGVRQVFHHVDLKPGKPVWYGVLDRSLDDDSGEADRRCHVFGLPGNPVSSMVCFELFARPAIRRLMGHPKAEPTAVRARLSAAHKSRGDRPTYHPARLYWEDGCANVATVAWQGSADLFATVDANSMVLFPPGDRSYAAGELVDVFPWDVSSMT